MASDDVALLKPLSRPILTQTLIMIIDFSNIKGLSGTLGLQVCREGENMTSGQTEQSDDRGGGVEERTAMGAGAVGYGQKKKKNGKNGKRGE